MAGGAAVGKSTVIKAIKPMTEGFVVLNPDTYIEDKNSPMYNNLFKASDQVVKIDIPNAIKAHKNFIYDTTASTPGKILKLLEETKSENYTNIMVMVYSHPIISFIRNFKRERKVPAALS